MGQPLRAGARVTGSAIVAMKERVRGQTKREKEVVSSLRSADVAVLFNSAKQCHTLNSKFLEDLELRLSNAVNLTAAAVKRHLDSGQGVAVDVASPALLGGPTAVAPGAGAGGLHAAGASGMEWVVEGPGFVNVGDLLEQYASLWLIYTQYATSFAGGCIAE